jgi:D-arabinose 1-dehydrogenase-like Zn-dependent alcohol dehydrogenase
MCTCERELLVPPIIMGHETVGYIEAGSGVEGGPGAPLAEGDRVTWASSPAGVSAVSNGRPRDAFPQGHGISYSADVPPHLRGVRREYTRAGTAIFRLPEDLATDAVGAGCAGTASRHRALPRLFRR